jgi:hypothetical protein
MKRFLILLATALLAVPAFSATPADTDPADVKMETKTFNLSGFHGLQVSWTYQVALTQADHYSVRVEAPDFIIPYLDVKVAGDNLVLGIKELPKDIRRKVEMVLKHDEVRAWVAMPSLSSLNMSGASKLNATGAFSAPRFNFRLDLSGATAVQGLSVKAPEADFHASGAAKFDVNGTFTDLHMTLSGAISANLNTGGEPVDEASITMSGAVKFKLQSHISKLDLGASGAANFSMDGSLDALNANASGGVRFDLLGAPVKAADLSLSGAARAEIDVRESLSITLSGGSTCRYKAGPNLRIERQTISRGASLNQL